LRVLDSKDPGDIECLEALNLESSFPNMRDHMEGEMAEAFDEEVDLLQG